MYRITALFLATHLIGCSQHHAAACGQPFDEAKALKELAVGPDRLVGVVDRIDSALAACPADASLLTLKFFALLRLGKHQDAASAYEEFVNSDSPDFGAHAEVAYIYRQMGKHDRALKAFDRALEHGPKADLLYERARLLADSGRTSQAIADLETAMALSGIPDATAPVGSTPIGLPEAYQVDVGTMLFDLYWDQGRGVEAKALLDRLNSYRDDPEVEKRREIVDGDAARER